MKFLELQSPRQRPRINLIAFAFASMIGCGPSTTPAVTPGADGEPVVPSAPGAEPLAGSDQTSSDVPTPEGGALCSPDGWCWQNPLPQGNALKALWGKGKELVAVGVGGTVLHFDGARWKRAATPTSEDLNAVWGGSHLIAVGNGGVILRQQGGQWQREQSGTTQHLHGVWTHDGGAFAAGRNGTLLSFDGTRWSSQTTPAKTDLYGVWGRSKDDVFVAGKEVLLHFDGKAWKKESVGAGTFPGTLQAVWGRDADVWAAGWDRRKSIVFRNQDGKWAEAHAGKNDYTSYYALSGSPGSVLAVGARLAHRFDGAQWSDLGAPNVNLWASWTSDDDHAYVVGDQGRVFTVSGGKLEEISTGFRHSLDGIWGWADDGAVAVGYGGQVLRYDGARWEKQASSTSEHLRAVWGSGQDDIHAVGDRGTVLHFDGSAWKAGRAPTDENLLAVAGSGPNDVWAVGRKGSVAHYDGKSWSASKGVTDQHLQGVWAGGGKAVAVGKRGLAVHYDGSRWTSQATGTEADLNGVFGRGPNEIYAVGDGVVLKYDGKKWSQVATPKAALTAVSAAGSKLFAVGSPGAVIDGAGWKMQASGVAGTLRAVWVSPGGQVLAVGDHGAIIAKR